MKVSLFIVADPYDTKGWAVVAVDHSDKWQMEHNADREDAFLYRDFDLTDPTPENLVEIGLARVDEMKATLIKENMTNTARIKEFESKFPTLSAPELTTEELS